MQNGDGSFYGITYEGGTHGNYGTIFKITSEGQFTSLYSFCQDSYYCPDGSYPHSGLIKGLDGNFYGTTSAGGANNGYGTVYRMTPTGDLTTIYSFCSKPVCSDGGGLMVDCCRWRMGVSMEPHCRGGINGAYAGTLFKLTPSGELTTLYNFCGQPNCTDGQEPYAGLTQGTDRNFYGTTVARWCEHHGDDLSAYVDWCLSTIQVFAQKPTAKMVESAGGIDAGHRRRFYGMTSIGGLGFSLTTGGGTF